jgi:alpha-L-arabinofuranosidase
VTSFLVYPIDFVPQSPVIQEAPLRTRREFLQTTLAGSAALCLSRFPSLAAASPDSKIEILLNETQGSISPNIYGHFTEHLGGVVYDGIWVGANSKVPNIDGLRRDLIEHMKKIKAPVIRYPGGCFADSYDWRDGIGPAGKRPRRTNFWGFSEQSPAKHRYESNEFGTGEFAHFCKLIGAQPYLAANVRSLPAEEFYRWVEYCNSPTGSTSLAEERAKAGSAEPYNVRYWGIGNESWGCGGNFTAQQYAVEYRRYTAWVPGYGNPLDFIASGPNGDDLTWTTGFFEEILRKGKEQLQSIYGIGLHHYAWNLSRGKTTDWDKGKGDALQFDTADWYELLREGQRLEPMIESHWQAMGEFDKDRHVKLIVDEWGPWYRPGSEATPGDLLEQTPTLRDAVFSGMTLDILNRHASQVAMGNCAQLINCLNSLYLAHEDGFVVTPVGHVFDLYSGHQGGELVRAVFSAPDVQYDRDGKTAAFFGLNGSASLHGKELLLTVVNPDTKQPREAEILLRGASAASATGRVLTSPDIHACNTFVHRDAVMLHASEVTVRRGAITHTFPPASVSALAIRLA